MLDCHLGVPKTGLKTNWKSFLYKPVLVKLEQDGATFTHSVFGTANERKSFPQNLSQNFMAWTKFLKYEIKILRLQ